MATSSSRVHSCEPMTRRWSPPRERTSREALPDKMWNSRTERCFIIVFIPTLFRRQVELLKTLRCILYKISVDSRGSCFFPLLSKVNELRHILPYLLNAPRIFHCHVFLKGLSHLVQSCLLYRSCMSKDSSRSTGHVDHFFPNKVMRSLEEIDA